MKISIIVAMTENRVIGFQNQMPWHLPADLKHFKKVTLGKPIIMGRNTYHSIGRPLPDRKNIIISHNPDLVLPGCEIFHSLQSALDALKKQSIAEAMIIGGAQIFELALPLADKLYLTIIHTRLTGDVFFPENWEKQSWHEVSRIEKEADEQNQYACTFLELERQ